MTDAEDGEEHQGKLNQSRTNEKNQDGCGRTEVMLDEEDMWTPG